MIYKSIIIGDSGVGKSSIQNVFVSKKFNHCHELTIGVDFGSKDMVLKDGSQIKLHLWDTAGQEAFKSISRSYYRGAHGALVVFDLNKHSTFLNAKQWIHELKEINPSSVILLVGNKSDLVSRVNFDEIQTFIDDCECAYYSCSAKQYKNIDKIFDILVEKVYKNVGNNDYNFKHVEISKPTHYPSPCC